ncbi:NACHT domain-containing protein [Streptomyces sp. NBC_01433]|uniref:NACHT domain-containing protein n=1 Tax=Streptomyces sp. NBC_01433 TaxID=2903864 RepID=UPI00224E3862|nr:NACHT domain-containing protein [Streptomyces sp. NBC_01433]MCX4678171.1 NACHT domain-containing protein [Streptomyces sp. NBC_01433]
MSSTEVALIRLATTVIGTVAKSLLTPRPGAGLVRDPVRPLPRPAKPDRLAKVLGGRLAESYADLPEHERLAALASVQDTFAATGELGAERLFALELEPDRLRAELSAPAAGLSPRAAELYEELLGRCCAHAVEQLTAHPSFAARAAVEQIREAGRTRELVEDVRSRVGPRPDAVAMDFERRYADFVATANSRMGLFGLTLGRSASEWPLETAYLSPAVSGYGAALVGGSGVGPEHPERVTVRIEQALGRTDRLLLRGPAGSGKSTLVQWLALNAARRTFGDELAEWNRCVPFVLRLRAFTAQETLPAPEDFLRAAGIPLHGAAPAGWVDRLLTDGRALVLVDGVDEVPQRLRNRTERWLKDLIAAYPRARYVVTTRPSAVPEGWLSGAGFEAHTLLAMERDDIRAFVGHWHRAARSECRSQEERDELDTYESSLRHAVGTRRDLGRLATNPLMCALLCALNRDRRMQLPRARKELYDAALDMLLVRRDSEREIIGVEGVDLTREEQTALLQRLAYWLIRNGLAEAEHGEVVAMLAEWMASMSQVRGTPEQVFAHLLIRSGLLREPAPGAVGFVHRTFQDYLGAKAAVEARDFGVLVRHAHDDQWDDVVQMAVGHARVEERGRLLRQLLKRADQVRKHRHRLVLLAAASLAHAPELDPAVRGEVERRTAELLPPRSREEAEELAKVGELVLELLPGPEEVEDEYVAGCVVRTAALIGGDAAYGVVKRYRNAPGVWVAQELGDGWGAFDIENYAREVLAARTWDKVHVPVATDEQMTATLRYVPEARMIRLQGNHRDLSPLFSQRVMKRLFVYDNKTLTDLGPLASMRSVTELGLSLCPAVRDLSPLAALPLSWLTLVGLHPDVPTAQLEALAEIRRLHLSHRFPVAGVGDLPLGPHLQRLSLGRETDDMSLDGLDRWPELRRLGLYSLRQYLSVCRTPLASRLTRLDIHFQDSLDLAELAELSSLETLTLRGCSLSSAGLTPLRDLPALTELHLYLHHAHAPIDLGPLVSLDGLTIRTGRHAPVLGTGLFQPERIVHGS